MIKQIVKAAISRAGYSISKAHNLHDLELYKRIYGEDKVAAREFYNIGAGLFKHPAWTNIDNYSDWYSGNRIHINYDLFACQSLPLDGESASIVYSSHTIEHISDEAAQNMLNESHRILRKGGFVRLTTPNIDLYYKSVLNKDYAFWQWEIDTYSRPENMRRAAIGIPMKDVSIQQLFLFAFASQTSLLHINDDTNKISEEEFTAIFTSNKYEEALDIVKSRIRMDLISKYPGNHINWWNEVKLFKMLRTAGFSNIYLSAYGQSLCPVLRNINYFDNTHPTISIYVEATK